MQYRTPICQPQPARSGVLHPFSSTSGTRVIPEFERGFVYGELAAPIRGAAQEVAHTASRRSGPRRWLRAVAWWVTAAALHRRTGATVRAIAQDLAGRMDFDTGHARYCLDDVAAALGIDRATVKRRVAQLREAGLLAWAQHGSRTNVRRVLGLKGYAGTATVYAAVIPPEYDVAHGIERVGSGYHARIIVRTTAQGPVDNSPVDNPDAPPSLYVVKEEGKAEVDGGLKDTSRKRASRPTASASPTSSRATVVAKCGTSSKTAGRSPAQVARDCWIAGQVRPRVNWTQPEGIRRLAFALRPLIDRGLDVHDIAAELNAWRLLWRPTRPAAYIRAELAQQAAHEAALAAAVRPQDNAAWREWWQESDQQAAAEAAVMADLCGPAARTDADRRAARAAGAVDLRLVVEHLADYGPDDALDLYGPRLTSLADRLTAAGADLTTRW